MEQAGLEEAQAYIAAKNYEAAFDILQGLGMTSSFWLV